MIIIRKAKERGQTMLSWLESYHSFSFSSYYDPEFIGFESLRVINEDRVQPSAGFDRHSHKDMEIISYVISGAIEHKDSLGNGSLIKPGEIQRMSAGAGVEHSEFNPSKTEILHFLQIWIYPGKPLLKPEYEQKTIQKETNKLTLIGSSNKIKNSVTINQDVELFVGYFEPNKLCVYHCKPNRQGWLQLIKGKLKVNGQQLYPGDGAAIIDENRIDINSLERSEFLFFNLAIFKKT
ncbi:MAG: pirin family protein [Tatlockia sp.]|nr:pirin family protein [Tatlockia sp.]